jgi:hypothetical protein
VSLADSSPAPPAETDDPGWAINLNPQQGSSILGPRSPTTPVRRPPAEAPMSAPVAPPAWRPQPYADVRPSETPPAPEPPAAVFAPPPRMPAPPAPAPDAVSLYAEVPAPIPQPRPAYRPSVPPPAPLVLLPLVGINRLFDGFVIGFGPPGRWLRSPAGRTFLGVSGLMMTAGGVAWGALEWFGWTW